MKICFQGLLMKSPLPSLMSFWILLQVVTPPDGHKLHNRIFWTFDGTLRTGVLSTEQFCNGHVFFVQRIPQKQGSKVYAVHNTFQYYFGPGKIARFREEGIWLLDPDE